MVRKKTDELDELEQAEKARKDARRLAAILDQVRGLHPAPASTASAPQAAPLRGAEEAPARTHKSKAERRAARRKENEP